MNKPKRPNQRVATVGLTSLFAVLIVLCLVIFAILARLTAQSELALAQRAADTVAARYEAEYQQILEAQGGNYA
ncbi:MAG: hypothetical protein FWD35_02125 [Oscillospiraceae bacterium]|nr:hypothetical protein [Oscillospiraceae bacterium]